MPLSREFLLNCSEFELFLRTGRTRSELLPEDAERKFNGWHSNEDGRFARVGQGRFYPGGFGGGGASGSWDAPRAPETTRPKAPPTRVPVDPILPRARPARPVRPVRARPVRTTIVRNGYSFEIDERRRTRKVTGELHFTPAPTRSRTNQAGAGRPDRRRDDDGGHYIAARFNGPRDKFNHFAQNANFNRGAYRELENQWAKAMTRGQKVNVRIEPTYDGLSNRPKALKVTFTVNGNSETRKFRNERGGTRND